MELILKTLEKELSPYGFDLISCLNGIQKCYIIAGLYNKEMPEKNQVVDFGNPQNLCVVIGILIMFLKIKEIQRKYGFHFQMISQNSQKYLKIQLMCIIKQKYI